MVLKEHGYDAKDIRDYGLRGAADEAVILTGDRDFGNILRFPLGDHFGIVVAHFPNEMPTLEINRYLL
jgi:predicted nuclease of predicted toxin-antitoxin system